MEKMVQTYGPVFSMYIAETLVVVINGFSSVKDLLVTKSTEFADRPSIPIIDACINSKGLPFDPYDIIDSAVTNIISTLVFGKRFEYDDSSYRNVLEMIHQGANLLASPWAMLFNTVPFVRKLPLPHRTVLKAAKQLFEFLRKELDKHKATHVCGQPRDFIDKYLEEMQKSRVRKEDLWLVGETVVDGEKCQKEMDTILGNNTCLKYEDREKLPYTNAVIHEIQRVSNVVPLGIPHAPTKDVQFHGYTIPKGTMVLANIVSVHHDKSQWKYPCEFNPSNFLDDEGDFLKPEAFLPFSAGMFFHPL
ncbi:hypothetical protein lerEdw1_001000 [Lerista edwardsae]|nr:hypothetical protein lerEdw1_001000 [Lerista edwardsae]